MLKARDGEWEADDDYLRRKAHCSVQKSLSADSELDSCHVIEASPSLSHFPTGNGFAKILMTFASLTIFLKTVFLHHRHRITNYEIITNWIKK